MHVDRHIVVTSALPYANGHLHLGHLLEHIQTHIWVQTHKMLGHQCISICGDDAHGTPIMLKAERCGMTPEALTESMQASHMEDFTAFGIHYDSYHTTHSAENQELAERIFLALQEKGDILKKDVSQAYDPVKNMFLPDRYIKGNCPICKAADQYGDSCEACGATYDPTDLINPVSVLSGVPPITKTSTHYFFNLPHYEALLKEWTKQGHLQAEVVNKLDEWFTAGLKPWDISRDAPYFGFLIPGTQDKYFYVWLDAPIGYMASFKKYCEEHNVSFDAVWGRDSQAELYHFIGKDIVYFHALFWPGMLAGSNHRLPTAIFAHGFLTINGQKMSKSRGTFIEAKTYLNHLNPEYLRYYFAAKLNGKIDDLDLHFDDFINRINADLVGKVINIASRCAGFINKRFNHQLSSTLCKPELYEGLLAQRALIIDSYLERDYARAMRLIIECADVANQYIDAEKPWILAKDESYLDKVQDICTMGLNLFRVIMTYLKPVLPQMAARVEQFLQCEPFTWQNIDRPLTGSFINPFTPLMVRVERDKINAMLQETREKLEAAAS